MTITTATDLWIEQHIADGRLAPGARGMTRDEAAHQYNEANCLTAADDDYLHAPEQAQKVVHDALRLVGLDVPDHTDVTLTDRSTGPRHRSDRVSPSQVEAACEQFRLVTGDALSAEAIVNALPWIEDGDICVRN